MLGQGHKLLGINQCNGELGVLLKDTTLPRCQTQDLSLLSGNLPQSDSHYALLNINILMMNGFSHHYQLGEYTFIFRGFRHDFKMLLHFLMKFLYANRIAPDGKPHIWGYSSCQCPIKNESFEFTV